MVRDERARAVRRFQGAMVASVCLHGLALGVFARSAAALPAADLPPVLQVLLRPAEMPAEVQPAAAPPPAAALGPNHFRVPRAKAAVRAPAGLARPPEPAAGPSTVTPPAEPVALPAEPVALPPLAALAPRQPEILVAPQADPAALAGYGQAIAAELGRLRRYPPLALLRGWEGTATLRLHLGADGRLRQAMVASSSGREVLDRQALAMAEQLAAWPPRPASLPGGELTVLVPVVFRLE